MASNEQVAKENFGKITELGGKVKNHNGINGIWFDGPPERPENALFIPLYVSRFMILDILRLTVFLESLCAPSE